MDAPQYRIGVDVGGTNTDAVLISTDSSLDRGVIATFKHTTTTDVTTGIQECVRAILRQANIAPERISGVMVGTTHFINAVIASDTSHLSRVAVLRLGYPYTLECPPFIGFPPNLRSIVEGYWGVIDGGLQIDGSEIKPINERQVREECRKIRDSEPGGVPVIVVVGVHSPLQEDGLSQEDDVRKIILDELGASTAVVCSRDVGQIGLLERENAAILNAAILHFARQTIHSFHRAIVDLGLSCPLYLTQNDGTLTSAAKASRLPIRTFSSGATNSMRGASYLAGLGTKDGLINDGKPVIVVDVGGTSTDVGVLLPSGFPRQAAAFIEVAGIRTNFSMPDVQSIGLGGGSRVRFFGSEPGQLDHATIGPDSVGRNLLDEALVFGGSVVTATDVAAAVSDIEIGDPSIAVNRLSNAECQAAEAAIKRMLEVIVDKMKTTPEPAKVLLVGGGSIIAPKQLAGVEDIIQPPFFDCANAVGAAVALVSGEVDTVEILDNRSIEVVTEYLKKQAIDKAIRGGAKPETVRVVEVEILPVQYVTNKVARIIIRAVGELDSTASQEQRRSANIFDSLPDVADPSTDGAAATPSPQRQYLVPPSALTDTDIRVYHPNITGDAEWYLSEIDLEWIQEGCGILGAGGGGSPYPPFLMAREILRAGHPIRIINSTSLPNDALVFRGSFMGSPSVSNERLQSGNEIETAARSLMKHVNVTNGAAIISEEIGGGNGLQPMILASEKHLNLPVFDGDLMGRAYPRMEQTLPATYDIPNSLTPCAVADGVGNCILLSSTSDKGQVEAILRNICTTFGSKAGVSMAPLRAEICRDFGVTGTVSQAWRIGRAVALCRKDNNMAAVADAILSLQNGSRIFVGKIIDVQREVRAGFTWGYVRIAPLSSEEQDVTSDAASISSSNLMITFQNEFLAAALEFTTAAPAYIACVPDLITVLDSQSGSSLGTHELRYGLRVTCLALAGHPRWTTPQGLACGGPAAFGLDESRWTPVGEYIEPKSVIDEFYKG